MRKLLLSIALLFIGCGGSEELDEAHTHQPPPPRAFVLPQPPPAPTIPVVQQPQPAPQAQPAQGFIPQVQRPLAMRQAQPQPDPQQVQADLLAKYQGLYAEYAAKVAKLEAETGHISAKDLKHRKQFYWMPLNNYAEELQARHQITGYQLAQIVNQGQNDNWPTKDEGDGAAIARMFRRVGTEQALLVRHAEARANMAMLDALVDSIVWQATVAGSNSGTPIVGRRIGYHGILPPIYTGPPIGVRIGQPTIRHYGR